LGAKKETFSIDKAFVDKQLGELAANEDLTRFIL
jgi:ATP-dependent HslUV protease ATP-binding subunit HslU